MEVFIIRHGNVTLEQTGGGLNFEVVGGTIQPTSPKENTIWINTDREVAGWAINWNDPTATQSELYHSDIGLTTGTYLKSDGTTASSADWRYTEDIPLPNQTKSVTVTTGSTSSSNPCHVFYDASGNLVSSVKRATGTNTYAVPSGAVSVRLSLSKNDVPSLIAVHDAEADDGFVWIHNKNQSNSFAFNAISTNELLVPILECKQYVDGQWRGKEIAVYSNGQWHNIWNGMLYEYGNQYGATTGGWQFGEGTGTVSVNAEDIALEINNSISALRVSASTVNAVDMSQYDTLYATVLFSYISKKTSTNPTVRLGVSSTPDANSANLSTKAQLACSATMQTYTLSYNISEINDPMHIVVGVGYPDAIMHIQKVWLEKAVN